MLKQERARVTRSNIVASAANSFSRHGFSGTSLADIIAEAGVTKGALYFHFESKEDVARAVIEAQLERVSQEFLDRRAKGHASLQTLVELTASVARRQDESTLEPGFRLAAELSSLQPAVVEPYYRSWNRMIASLIEEAIEQGDVRPNIAVDVLADFLVSALAGMELVSEALAGRTDLAVRTRRMWQLLLPDMMADGRDEIGEILTVAFAEDIGRRPPNHSRSATPRKYSGITT